MSSLISTDRNHIPREDQGFASRLLNHVEAAVVLLASDGRVLHTNREAEKLLDVLGEEVLGREIFRLVDGATAEQLRQALSSAQAEGTWEGEIPVSHRSGVETPTYAKLTALTDETGASVGTVGILVDITGRKQAERLQAAELAVANALVVAAGLDDAAPRVLRAICETLDWQVAELWRRDPAADVLRSVASWHSPEVDIRRLKAVSTELTLARGVGLPGVVWDTEEPRWIVDMEHDARVIRSEEALAAGLNSAFAFPIHLGEDVIGVMSFFSRQMREPDSDLLHTMTLIGNQIANFNERMIAVQISRTVEDRLRQTLQTLQQSLLPAKLPLIAGLDFAARYLPSGATDDVGGDFYDLFPLSRYAWAVNIGDVCGKGPEAAVVTALARHTMRAVAPDHKRPSGVLRALNEVLLRESERFVTAIFGRFQFSRNSLKVTLSVAGHPLPKLVRTDGTVETVGRGGTLLGVLPKPELHDAVAFLHPGDALVLITDGFLDTRAPGMDEAKMNAILDECGNCEASEIANRLIEAVQTGGRPLRDDIALLVIQLIR